MTTIANIQSVQEEKNSMSSASLNQFHNEDLQEQCNTAAVAQELSDAELESVAGGFFWLIPALAAASVAARAAAAAAKTTKGITSSRVGAAGGGVGAAAGVGAFINDLRRR